MTGADTQVQGKRKTKVGRVVSDRMDKTIVVSVERLARHRLYKRVIRLSTKFKAHDEANDARIGDRVAFGNRMAELAGAGHREVPGSYRAVDLAAWVDENPVSDSGGRLASESV